MAGFEFDATSFINKLTVTETKALGASLNSMQDSLDDLKRISSEISPIKGSPLRKSANTKLELNPRGVVGEISYSVTEKTGKGRFNYALWIHEEDYNLGDISSNSPGTDGYEVGNKYLERPLKGESEKYVKWWAEAIGKEMG